MEVRPCYICVVAQIGNVGQDQIGSQLDSIQVSYNGIPCGDIWWCVFLLYSFPSFHTDLWALLSKWEGLVWFFFYHLTLSFAMLCLYRVLHRTAISTNIKVWCHRFLEYTVEHWVSLLLWQFVMTNLLDCSVLSSVHAVLCYLSWSGHPGV